MGFTVAVVADQVSPKTFKLQGYSNTLQNKAQAGLYILDKLQEIDNVFKTSTLHSHGMELLRPKIGHTYQVNADKYIFNIFVVETKTL